MARIEIVSTSPHLRRRLANLLLICSHEAVFPNTVEEATFIYKVQKPDLAIIDICLSYNNGITLAKDLLLENNEIRVIAMTDIDLHNHRLQAVRSGIRDLLIKPFTDAEFLSTVDKYLEGINVKHS